MPAKSESFSERRAVIRELLGREVIKSQAQLLERLQARGYHVTQSSVSRDLQELHVARVEGRYVTAEALLGANGASDDLKEAGRAIQQIATAGTNLLVIHTPAGRAQMVGMAIDHAGWSEALGTVAGDDTLFVATAGPRQQARMRARLARLAKESHHV